MKLALALLLPLAAVTAPRPAPLVVKASPVASPCVAAAAPLFERATGRALDLRTVKLGPARSADGADVVVGAEEELTRVIEGGASREDVDADVATIPWVFAGADPDPVDLRALALSDVRVRVLGGSIGRHARESLEQLPPERVRSVQKTESLGPLPSGELALVPLSLAQRDARVSATNVPPLLIRALGVAASPNPEAARAFVAFLAAGDGNAAFRACGRDPKR
jgi:hypothetical protein